MEVLQIFLKFQIKRCTRKYNYPRSFFKKYKQNPRKMPMNVLGWGGRQNGYFSLFVKIFGKISPFANKMRSNHNAPPQCNKIISFSSLYYFSLFGNQKTKLITQGTQLFSEKLMFFCIFPFLYSLNFAL